MCGTSDTAASYASVVVDSGQGTTRIAGVDDARRLDEQRVDFPIRDRAVLDTSRYDEQLAGAEPHVAVAQLNGQLTSNDDESSWFCSGTHRAASSSTSGRSRTPTPPARQHPCTACTGRSCTERRHVAARLGVDENEGTS